MALRFLLMRNLDNFSQETLQLSNIWFFGIQYVVGTYIWTLSWPAGTTPTFLGSGSTVTDLSTTWIVSMLILAVDAVAFAIACWSNMHRSGQRLRGINSRTLDCLLGSHRLLQRQMQVFYGQFAIGQLAEISVCIQIAGYSALSAVWSQPGAWMSLADRDSDHHLWGALSKLLLQLTFQVWGLGIYQCTQHLARACPEPCTLNREPETLHPKPLDARLS